MGIHAYMKGCSRVGVRRALALPIKSNYGNHVFFAVFFFHSAVSGQSAPVSGLAKATDIVIIAENKTPATPPNVFETKFAKRAFHI